MGALDQGAGGPAVTTCQKLGNRRPGHWNGFRERPTKTMGCESLIREEGSVVTGHQVGDRR